MANDSCPFSPGSRPPVLAGRAHELELLKERLGALHDGRPSSCVLVVGQVGNGRTTLVREFARSAAETGWSPAIVALAASDDLGQQVARGLATAALHLRQHRDDPSSTNALLRAVHSFGLAYGVDLPVGADAVGPEIGWSSRLHDDVSVVLEEVGTLCRQLGSGLVLIFDDAPGSVADELTVLVSAAANAAQAGLPVMVVVTGLASLPRLLADRWLPEAGVETIVVSPLGPDDIAEAVVEPARRSGRPFTLDGLESFVRRCRGLPTFAQLLARDSWLASEGPISEHDVAIGAAAVERHLVTTVYEPIHRALSPAHRRFLQALSEEGGTASFESIRRRLGDTNRFDPNASGLVAMRDDLFAREVLASPDGQTLEFTLAGFDRYIQKAL
jgi:AAA ATPase domain